MLVVSGMVTWVILRVLQEVANVAEESPLVVRTDSSKTAEELATPLHWGGQTLLCVYIHYHNHMEQFHSFQSSVNNAETRSSSRGIE